MIKFHCSHCNKKISVPDDYAGRSIRCSGCNQSSVVPDSEEVEMKLQSIHDDSQPLPAYHPDLIESDSQYSLTEMLKRCQPDAELARTERQLDILSFISCIGPVFFILIIFAALFIASRNNDPRVMHAPFAEPDTGPITGPLSLLAAFPAIRYCFYAVGFGVSPIAMILSLYLVFRHSLGMSKILYFVMVIYGLILLTFCIG
jgi:hypothetical protein